ncbi:hypothetical protein HMPREF9162_2213 [Selenomonas sp. oral taxon 137 str. F0430]|nr:hypothetical protein HMPREF9162_2213 [Selenomonas sp. oral taxon 137 str. F0430]
MRGATAVIDLLIDELKVSIHAPRAGRDGGGQEVVCCMAGFNPRAPCGARRLSYRPRSGYRTFQSTRPVRGATEVDRFPESAGIVSIHAPRAGRDRKVIDYMNSHDGFNPRAPCGARPYAAESA